jgi:hypothetical protein
MNSVHFVFMAVVTLLSANCTTCPAQILLENKSKSTLYVFLQGANDKDFSIRVSIQPEGIHLLNIAPGYYYVATKHPNGTFSFLHWQNYSNHKITYNVSLCTICAPASKNKKTLQLPSLLTTAIHHTAPSSEPAANLLHTKEWIPGFKDDDLKDGKVDAYGDMLTYRLDHRLGICYMTHDDGVLVTQTIPNSPSMRLKAADSKQYFLQAGDSVIKGINGKRVRNVDDYFSLIADAPENAELIVTSLKGKKNVVLHAKLDRW